MFVITLDAAVNALCHKLYPSLLTTSVAANGSGVNRVLSKVVDGPWQLSERDIHFVNKLNIFEHTHDEIPFETLPIQIKVPGPRLHAVDRTNAGWALTRIKFVNDVAVGDARTDFVVGPRYAAFLEGSRTFTPIRSKVDIVGPPADFALRIGNVRNSLRLRQLDVAEGVSQDSVKFEAIHLLVPAVHGDLDAFNALYPGYPELKSFPTRYEIDTLE
ncbi:hypothetical protein JCM10212_003785 [Sporobolomyces blumeae]